MSSETPQTNIDTKSLFAQRFRGYFPVVVDVETAGFNAKTDALLEIAATTLHLDETTGLFSLDETICRPKHLREAVRKMRDRGAWVPKSKKSCPFN